MSSKKFINRAPRQNGTEAINTMTVEQLRSLINRLKEENEREKEQCKIIQAEREKYRGLCEETASKLEAARAELVNKERNFEEVTKAKDRELSDLKQQLSELERESQIEALKQRFNEDISKTKKEFADQTRSFIHALRQQFYEDITKAKSEFRNEAKQMDLKLGKKLDSLREEVKIVEYEADIDLVL